MGYFDEYNKAHLPDMDSYPTARISDLKEVPFSVLSIRFKEKMVSKYGVRDTYILDIALENGDKYTVFANQVALMSKIRWMQQNGGYLDPNLKFAFIQRTSESGSVYWDLTAIDLSE